MKHVLLIISVCTHFLCSCSALTEPECPYSRFNESFITDVIPLTPPNSDNLQDIAKTLPFWETGDPDEWIHSGPGAILKDDHWYLIPDGAQGPVEIFRLPFSTEGKTRVRVVQGPYFTGFDVSSHKWIHDIERAEGGWKVTASKTVSAEQDAAPNHSP